MSKKYLLILLSTLLIVVVLTGCSYQNQQQVSNTNSVNQSSAYVPTPVEFTGEKGQKVTLDNKQIRLESNIFDDGLAHFYNTQLEDKTVYFFVVKDKNGIYRAAANACQVCAESKTGFHQQGDYMVCNTCQNKYPLEKIATEKGGCNPVPINPNLEMENGKIVINQSDLDNIYGFF